MSSRPFWKPSIEFIEQSNIFKMMQEHGFENYEDFWKWSVTQKEIFWEETIQNLGIKLALNYTSILDISKGVENAQWLKNAKLNIVDSCFQNEDDSIAVIFQEEGKKLQKVTQKELLSLVNQIANSFSTRRHKNKTESYRLRQRRI